MAEPTTTLEELAAKIAAMDLPYLPGESTDADTLAAEMLGIEPDLMTGIMEVWMKASSVTAQRRKAARLAKQAALAEAAQAALEES